jgi:DNA-binding transcriptional LysR family regulator
LHVVVPDQQFFRFCARNVAKERGFEFGVDRMLDDGLLDFVFGVNKLHKGAWVSTPLCEEPLLFIPRGAVWTNGPTPQSVQLKTIADETYVMVPDACGLARTTRTLFRSQRRKLLEYSGEAMSYQVLAEWAALGIGAAILSSSKIAGCDRASVPMVDKSGRDVMIGFEATWARVGAQSAHLLEFANHLRKVVPMIVNGLQPTLKR